MTTPEYEAFDAILSAHKERVLRPVAKYLAVAYDNGGSVTISELCDNELDPTGNLLGWVREEAGKLRNRKQ